MSVNINKKIYIYHVHVSGLNILIIFQQSLFSTPCDIIVFFIHTHWHNEPDTVS